MLRKWAHPVKNLYQKALKLSDSKSSSLWIFFLISLRGFLIFSIPTDVVFIPLCLGNPKKCLKVFALAALAGAIFGGAVGYCIGFFISEPLASWLISHNWMTPAQWTIIIDFIKEYGILAIGLGVLTPVPFALFALCSGIFQISFLPFLLTILVSRGIKFYLQSILLYYYGEQIKSKIDKYFHYLFYALIVLTIFFVAYKIIH